MHASNPSLLSTLAVALLAPVAQGCTSQGGPGQCNFELTGSFQRGGSHWYVNWDTAEVWDYECNSIGITHPTRADGSPKYYFEEGDAIDSQLPYTIVLSHIGASQGGTKYDKLGIQYADFDSGWVTWACNATESDTTPQVNERHSCIKAFPCTAS